MRISVQGTCRGGGKVYTRFAVKGLSDNLKLMVVDADSSEPAVPCAIYETLESGLNNDERSFVGTFPIVDKSTITYSINAIDERGTVRDSHLYRLNYELAKWQSRLNYRLNKDLCNQIRDYDRIAAYDKAVIDFWEAIDTGDSIILRCAVYTPYREDSDISLTVINEKLEPIEVSSIPFGIAKLNTQFSTKRARRETQLSIRLPHDPCRYIFQVQDKKHPSFNNFSVLDGPVLRDLISFNFKLRTNAQFDPKYPVWFKANMANPGDLSKQNDIVFPYNPTFSIIVPVYNTPLNLFKDMIESVLSQSYKHWELILVNASPENADLGNAVSKAKAFCNKVKVLDLDTNFGIAGNTNRGIQQADGDFICFFDHDDILEPNLLFSYAEAINNDKEVDLLYCDEDKLMPDGTLAQPLFKPDFDIDLLRNVNYICHMLCIRKELLDTIEPSTRELDGAQDHDLTLKAVEKARKVRHIPRVLYHWRITEASTAASADSKPYATQAGITAVQNHLNRLGIDATVSQSRRPFNYKVTYCVPKDSPLVSIIIPTKDHIDVLDTCIKSILEKSTYPNYEIILIENNSTEKATFDYYKRIQQSYPDKIRVAYWKHEFNFSKLMNFGAKHAYGDYLLLLNNDTEVITPHWIETMLGICARKEVGAVGVKLLYPDDTIQHAGVAVGGDVAGHLGHNYPKTDTGYFDFLDCQRQLSAVTAACVMTPKDAFESVGGFTEELTVAFNDIDYCLKLGERGMKIVYTPEVELFHYESISRGADTTDVHKRVRFKRESAYMHYRWADIYVQGDPCMNPNFDQGNPGIYNYWLS